MKFRLSKTFEIETSITLDYRRSAWGLERIVLDGISNHLPADAGGTNVAVRVKQDGQWTDLKQADPHRKVEEVVMEDDGKGYTSTKLGTLRSTKLADAISVGQFGEGLKLVAAAALRHDLNLEYHSRNWYATPFKKPETDEGEQYDRLCFRITENGDHLQGSRTVFRQPSPEFVEELFQLPDKVLALNDAYRELHNEKDGYSSGFGYEYKYISFGPRYHSRIIDLGTGKNAIFVKGIRVQGSNTLFGYDLGLEDVTPDRAYTNYEKVLDRVEWLLKGCTNVDVIKRILSVAKEQREAGYLEFQALNPWRKQKRDDYLRCKRLDEEFDGKTFGRKVKEANASFPWVLAFKELYGEKAVLASMDTNENNDATLLGFIPVALNSSVWRYLKDLGVDDANQIARGKKEYKWVSIDDLTPGERELYHQIPTLNEVAFGEREAIPLERIRIYEGMYFSSGTEAESDLGMTLFENGKPMSIGLKRSTLQNPQEFALNYFHEAGHYLTGKYDGSREHANFGYAGMARLAWEKLKGEGKKQEEQ